MYQTLSPDRTVYNFKPLLQVNWWQVDLQGIYPVYLVVIHNRWDGCCQSRINKAVVTLDGTKCGVVNWMKGITVYPISCGGRKGRIVKITHNKIINIAD